MHSIKVKTFSKLILLATIFIIILISCDDNEITNNSGGT